MDSRLTQTMGVLRAREIQTKRVEVLTLKIEGTEGAETKRLEGRRFVVGAHPQSDIRIEDSSVSGAHCELLVSRSGDVTLRDQGSKNGTWVSKVRIREASLRAGASFEVGGSRLTLLGIGDRDVPMSVSDRFGHLWGEGPSMGELFAMLDRVAAFDLSVLVTGETGTGKELVARSLHEHSKRAGKAFVVFDATTVSGELAESELFGYRKGAFTGAVRDKPGIFQEADGGTLFIDEVGELPLELQGKLLRALEAGTARRVGDTRYESFDARVIAATHRDLLSMVGEGKFREDLYFRLFQLEIRVPALREREEGNVSMLAERFLAGEQEDRDDDVLMSFDRSAYRAMETYSWPGNVRELRNLVAVSAALAKGPVISAEDLRFRALPKAREGVTSQPLRPALLEFERHYLQALLLETGGSHARAAERAGLPRSTFSERLKRVGLR